MKRLKIFAVYILAVLFALSFAWANGEEDAFVSEISKYGNLVLSVSATEFFEMGYEHGDIVTVHIAGQALDMPVCTNYTDVDTNSMVLRAYIDEEAGEDRVVLAISMGDLAAHLGIAEKTSTEEAPGYIWQYTENTDVPVGVRFSMKEEAGYLSQFLVRQLVRTNDRNDYAHLSDRDFANFRPVSTSGMGENRLFRSSSPINPELGRNVYADKALGECGIQTVINLADSPDEMKSYPGFEESAYSKLNVISLSLSVDVKARDFSEGFARGLRFLISNEGPYLIHCTEGKDRAGFANAVLECLMGAEAEEVIEDYMTTFYNYYGVGEGTEAYYEIADSGIVSLLNEVFEVESIKDENADLSKEAEAYLSEKLGLTDDEIGMLREKLS